MKLIRAMLSDRTWFRKVSTSILFFFVAYLAVTIMFLPSVRFYGYRFFRHWLLPNSLKTSWSPSNGPMKIGDRVTFPQLQSLSDSALQVSNEKFTLVTSFSLSCSYAAKSVPFWMRTKDSLPADKANYLFIGCSQSIEDIKSFVQGTDLMGNVFFGACDQVEPVFKSKGGITHCLLDKNGVCLRSWTGMPVDPQYEVLLIDYIAELIRGHSQ